MSSTLLDGVPRVARATHPARWGRWLHDPLAAEGRRVPQVATALIASGFSGLAIIALYRLGGRFGWQMPMFKKEGFLENLTFLLECWGALLCCFAAARTRASALDPQDNMIAAAYALCGTLLFVVAMEEISWGQQLIAFHTPDAWAAVNRQGETTLHNIAGKHALKFAWKIVGVCFLLGVIATMAAAQLTGNKVLRWIAPHVALLPLAVLIAFAAVAVHPEVAEVLIAIFFAFYAYRVYVASYTPKL